MSGSAKAAGVLLPIRVPYEVIGPAYVAHRCVGDKACIQIAFKYMFLYCMDSSSEEERERLRMHIAVKLCSARSHDLERYILRLAEARYVAKWYIVNEKKLDLGVKFAQ